jgi:DNA-binding Xre family transcriptional regulator
MDSYLNFSRLAKLIRQKRGEQGLRETAETIGEISPSTLSRIEGERVKDVNVSTFLRLCDWLEVAPSTLIEEPNYESTPELDVSDSIELQLRAAKNLDNKTKTLLTEMIKLAFQDTTGETNA